MTPVGCGGKEIGGGFKRLDFTSTMEMSLALALDPGILKFNRVKCEEQGLPMNLKPDEVYLRRETEDESIQQKIERKIDLLTASESVEGVGAWLELLRDREEWIAAPQWAQERAINAVSERIGPTFSFVGTQVYACAEQSHLMAQFEHGVSGVRLNLLPGGRLLRRAPNHFQEMPVQQVHLRPFLMAVTPVTQAEWDRIGGLDQRKWRGPNRPIETVSWNDGEAWLKKTGDGLRLPSEAEWEYACRAGATTDYCFGNDLRNLNDYAWTAENSGRESREVERLKPNAFGLYDVHGNVWEWCQDIWHSDYFNAPSDGSAWTTGGDGSLRIVRGGCWRRPGGYCSASYRNNYMAVFRESDIGFRPCRDLV